MSFVSRAFLLLTALGLLADKARALSQDDRTVQTLANFGALQRLAAKGDRPVRAYLRAASAAYIHVGYDDFGPALRRIGPALVAQLDGKDTTLRSFRAALRTLDHALEQDQFIALPQKQGSSMADYYGVASVFLDHAHAAFKNLSKGKNIANTLRNFDGGLFITKTDSNTFSLGSLSLSFGGADEINFDSASFVKTDAGSLIFTNATGSSSATGYLGATNVASGSLSVIAVVSGAILTFHSKLIALPPGTALPYDANYTILRKLTAVETFGSIELPAGTQLLSFPGDSPLPDGVQEVTSTSGTFALLGSNSLAKGTGSFTFSSNNGLGDYTLVGATATFQPNVNFQWVAFPPGSALPDGMTNLTLLLGRDYQTGATLLTAGTRIGMLGVGVTLPDGAVALPARAFMIGPVP